MSYHRNRHRLGSASPMGDVASVVKTGAEVVADPYFGETVCRVQQLRAIERGEKVVPACATTPPNIGGGVGLRKAMPALRGYVWAERNRPLSYALVAAGVIGLPMLIGYAIGKKG